MQSRSKLESNFPSGEIPFITLLSAESAITELYQTPRAAARLCGNRSQIFRRLRYLVLFNHIENKRACRAYCSAYCNKF